MVWYFVLGLGSGVRVQGFMAERFGRECAGLRLGVPQSPRRVAVFNNTCL